MTIEWRPPRGIKIQPPQRVQEIRVKRENFISLRKTGNNLPCFYAELFLQTKLTLVKDGPRKIKNSNALDSLFADLDQDLEQQYEEEEFEFFLMG